MHFLFEKWCALVEGTYAMLGRPLHLEFGFGTPMTVQKCPLRKLQLAHSSELKCDLNVRPSSNQASPELVSSTADPTLSQGETAWWTKSGWHIFATVLPSNIKTFYAKPAQRGTDTQVELKNFTVVRKVLHNNYWSHNLIGPCHFWGISPRNLTLFTRPFLARRHTQAWHKTTPECAMTYQSHNPY